MEILVKLWEFIKAAVSWSLSHVQLAVILGLCAALMVSSKCNNEMKTALDQLTADKSEMEVKYNGQIIQLKSRITLLNNQVSVVVRENGELKKRVIYVPTEGGVDVQNFGDTTKTAGTTGGLLGGWWQKFKDFFSGQRIDTPGGTVLVRDRGLTAKPGFGIFWDGGYNDRAAVPALDLKLLFWKRWSAGLGSTLNAPYVWGSRHLDDLTFGIVANTEFSIGYGKPYNDFEKSLLMLGLRTNL